MTVELVYFHAPHTDWTGFNWLDCLN